MLLSEIVVFLPYIAHERSTWLFDRIEDAAIAAIAAGGGTVDAAKRDELLRLSGTEAIRLTGQDGSTITVGNTALQPAGDDRPRDRRTCSVASAARSLPSCCVRTD